MQWPVIHDIQCRQTHYFYYQYTTSTTGSPIGQTVSLLDVVGGIFLPWNDFLSADRYNERGETLRGSQAKSAQIFSV